MEENKYHSDIIALLEKREEDIDDFDGLEEYLATDEGKQFFKRVSDILVMLKKESKEIFDCESFMILAEGYLNEGDYDNAIRYFEQALTLEPNNIDCLFRISTAYKKAKQNEMAEKYFNKILNLGFPDMRSVEIMETIIAEENYTFLSPPIKEYLEKFIDGKELSKLVNDLMDEVHHIPSSIKEREELEKNIERQVNKFNKQMRKLISKKQNKSEVVKENISNFINDLLCDYLAQKLK